VSDLVSTQWWGHDPEPLPEAATLRFATALVKDGMTGVTLVVPRAPGVLARAHAAARAADVEVSAQDIGSATITLRFRAGRAAAASPRPARRRWAWLPGWVRAWALGSRPQLP
jgi:hypothetical protein